MAKNDPTIRTLRGGAPEYPEGTHPPAAPSDQAWGPYRFSYSDMPKEDKPDESTVAQVMDSDPLHASTSTGGRCCPATASRTSRAKDMKDAK